ncbi:TPA: LysM peptidoglycan-binding domain-containing protein [Enterococcus faecium]|jgi:murein DD-endopeptidase MepM/ murein hydrolase activator NlpD|uniref:LysM domain/BON superfamily protein n=1 Tax=Enterococcus faecium TaxID=1352 RepID=A0A6N2YBM3_ENTFC|nr:MULTISPECIES: LysM peptidoglycan-binding domain-containing protein [Enterococcus]MBA5809959.1 LysM peptidoglycan-binding domain-containing protein [Enterococcus faecium]MDQ8353969.1 LysM peptidoglycan-binding domain-containing protein [Enterococcus faecium]MDQ8484240.1 LysM peptidoglycan-binding domain-containing protein [Enterococcus faecium]MEB7429236.1 LysM peptidoglycan-binding domain-containing protein [Enterococcus lactis]MUP23536.1 LysM peptidoglycan-binding domain-containing protein
MTSLKTLLFGTTLAAGAAFFMGTTAHADEAYTVQSGDTLSTISQKYVGDNSLINAIAESNSISDINLIYSGQQLTIPTEGSTQAAAEPQAAVQEAPVQAEPVQAEQPVVQETVQTETQAAPVAETQSATTKTTATSTNAAKEWIAQKESSGSYTATNGRYIGRYQLDSSYLNGDYSAANQEKVAEQYVASRYGSWEAAKAFWEANGWY